MTPRERVQLPPLVQLLSLLLPPSGRLHAQASHAAAPSFLSYR
jgi:hypothetical protein